MRNRTRIEGMRWRFKAEFDIMGEEPLKGK